MAALWCTARPTAHRAHRRSRSLALTLATHTAVKGPRKARTRPPASAGGPVPSTASPLSSDCGLTQRNGCGYTASYRYRENCARRAPVADRSHEARRENRALTPVPFHHAQCITVTPRSDKVTAWKNSREHLPFLRQSGSGTTADWCPGHRPPVVVDALPFPVHVPGITLHTARLTRQHRNPGPSRSWFLAQFPRDHRPWLLARRPSIAHQPWTPPALNAVAAFEKRPTPAENKVWNSLRQHGAA
ncbi:uncharacterized protein CC84DRAFT_1178480 [Paraphaeosphaeria sporulosa]|uniref:Uncharacterized protein n=1 Tax=Paraphaeosphaeria sporulosa TaxID=1460663 RepID=A0A177C5L8_9PLEO|nr:uncharacterized protein CC84DRAFT_1178480 [Paraphaeosphaeria sporulosa]OAG02913.1 hypothetical protein CC84DRAFT_1178480 [Paraphaeosphaeria sporulosa]